MRIVVDGIIFQKDPHGGVARLFRELLPRLCDLSTDLEMTLFIDGPIQSQIPQHPQIMLRRAPAVRKLRRLRGALSRLLYPFRRAASRAWSSTRQIWVGKGQDAIWHSTFFTFLPGWKGQAVEIVDKGSGRV